MKQQLRKAQAHVESLEEQGQVMQQRLAEAEATAEEFKAAAVEAEADLLTAQEDTVAQVATVTRRSASASFITDALSTGPGCRHLS